MDIESKLREIEQTNYWDAYTLDFRAEFFGDEAKLYIEIADGAIDEYCWELKFMRCYKVNYETDAGWISWNSLNGTRDYDMKDVRFKQLMSHSAQDISLSEEEHDMIACRITLSSMVINIICQQIEVSKVLIEEQNFFWKKNEQSNI